MGIILTTIAGCDWPCALLVWTLMLTDGPAPSLSWRALSCACPWLLSLDLTLTWGLLPWLASLTPDLPHHCRSSSDLERWLELVTVTRPALLTVLRSVGPLPCQQGLCFCLLFCYCACSWLPVPDRASCPCYALTLCFGLNQRGLGSRSCRVTCVDGGDGPPCASHRQLQLAWQKPRPSRCMPKRQPEENVSASAETYLRKDWG